MTTPKSLITADYQRTFSTQGVVGPIHILTSAECALISAYTENGEMARSTTWTKGLACSDHLIYAIATNPKILELIEQLAGPNLYLWGASIVLKNPGEFHPWHTDIETAHANGIYISVWIGLNNTSAKAGLQFIGQSHLIGMSLQQVAKQQGVRRSDRSAEIALMMAKQQRKSCSLINNEIHDGEAFFYDGRLWHGSHNLDDHPRKALLLQYAVNTSEVKIPDFEMLDFPFKYKPELPPGLIVRGEPKGSGNVVSPPRLEREKLDQAFISRIHSTDANQPWKPYYLLRGETAHLDSFSAHFSVLQPGHCPHPPHLHIEEELLIVIDGNAQVVDEMVGHALTMGDFVYYPAYQRHTIKNDSDRSITYLMFKWRGTPLGLENHVKTAVFRDTDQKAGTDKQGFRSELLFEGPTHFLKKLHVHRSYVLPNNGYEPHEDAHDVLITLIEGKLETMGEIIEAPALLYHPAGTPHGLQSVGVHPARYIVTEMHGLDGNGTPQPAIPSRRPKWFEKMFGKAVAGCAFL